MSVKNIKRPLILKRMLIRPPGNVNKTPANPGPLNLSSKLVKVSTIPLFREDVIFESNGEAFLPGEYRSVTIINKLNNITNNCTTIALCITHHDVIIEKTSVNITRIIGPERYNTVFYALCSVINHEYKIKALLSLLTVHEVPIAPKDTLTVTEDIKIEKIECMGTEHKSCQTDETRIDIKKRRIRKRIRKVQVPYVEKPPEIHPRRITVDPFAITPSPEQFKCTENSKEQDLNSIVKRESVGQEISSAASDIEKSILPDLGHLHDDSNDSVKSYSTLHSFQTLTDLLLNPISLVKNVIKHTKAEVPVPTVSEPVQPYQKPTVPTNHTIMLMDRSVVQLPFKPEDDFHIASKENLLYLNEVDRKKLLFHQMQIDYKHCLRSMDDDGNLPIHLAVINDDLELLKRQCVVLKIRKQSVDIPAKNDLTALKLSIFRESPSLAGALLAHGANPLLADAELRASFHLAAELRTEHLSHILHHCKLNARQIIIQHAEELQTPDWQSKSCEELGKIVLYHVCTLFDKQGYTPLMLASQLGLYENVRLLLESAPRSVRLAMPTSGNTALFLAVGAACTVAAERGNRSKVVDHFRQTIELLLDYGADPAIDNHAGTSVNVLLQEFNCSELSMLIANKVSCMKHFKGEEDYSKNCDKYFLMKDGNSIVIEDINWTKKKNNKTVGKTEVKEITKDEQVSGNHATNEMQKNVTENVIDKKVIDEMVIDEKVIDEMVIDEKVTDKKVIDKKVIDKKEIDLQVIDEKVIDKRVIAEKVIEKKKEKPIITENILIKKPLKIPIRNVTAKDFVINPTFKVTTVSTIKKVIWQCPRKRKYLIQNEITKRPKNT